MHFGEAAGLETFDKLEQKREMIEEELTGVVFAKDDKEYKDGEFANPYFSIFECSYKGYPAP